MSRARARSEADSGAPREPESASHVPAWRRAAPLALFALACGVYANTLANGWTLDDVPLVRDNPLVTQPGSAGEIFGSHYWAGAPTVGDHGLYRPVTIGSYALVRALFGTSAGVQHALNVLLHGLATVLLFVWIRPLVRPLAAAIGAAALFAVHPIHTEAVAGIVGRAELLAFCGAIGSVCALERARTAANTARASAWLALATLAYALAISSKETGLLAPALVVWTEVVFPERRWLVRRAPRALAAFTVLAVTAAALLYVRAHVVEARWEHPGWANVGAADRVWTALRVVGEYFVLLVWPVKLLAEYGVHDVPIARGAGEAVLALALLGALVAAAWSLRKRVPAFAWGIGLAAIAFALVSNVLAPIGVLKAERLLYLPSAGVFVACAAACSVAAARGGARTVVLACAGIALVALAARTWTRNGDWRDNRTIALSIQGVSPNSPVLETNLAIWHRENGRSDLAREALLRVLAAEPGNARTLAFLGDVELDLGEFASARARFENALRLTPDDPPLHMKLVRAQLALADWKGAANELEWLRKRLPDEIAAWLNLVRVYEQLGESGLAVERAREATVRFPSDARVWGEAAEAYARAGRENEANEARARASTLSR